MLFIFFTSWFMEKTIAPIPDENKETAEELDDLLEDIQSSIDERMPDKTYFTRNMINPYRTGEGMEYNHRY